MVSRPIKLKRKEFNLKNDEPNKHHIKVHVGDHLVKNYVNILQYFYKIHELIFFFSFIESNFMFNKRFVLQNSKVEKEVGIKEKGWKFLKK